WGAGFATSGDAQGGGGAGGASSGSVSATGLQVFNLVNMWADTSVDIEGNNYAPITVYIRFNTNIENYGAAGAQSGAVASGAAPAGSGVTTAITSAAPSASTGTGGSTSASSR